MKINGHYLELKDSYLFSTIAKKVKEFQSKNPEKEVIRLGIGDVTLPLVPVVVEAMKNAVLEMGEATTFHGYGEEQGYEFLREAVRKYYVEKKVELSKEEIFISDGAKSDLGNILDIFHKDNTVLIPDPVYPVYVDTNVMVGRKIIYAKANEKNDFLPMPEEGLSCDLIYICSPNNPTGAVYNKEQLKQWVDFANKEKAVILFDAAYEAFIDDKELPSSIFEIEGAKSCAIEFCSLSKTAGFTGTRCGYTIVPKELIVEGTSLQKLWLRRQTTKFNGVPYIVQKGAEAVFSKEGQKQTKEAIAYYKENAAVIRNTLETLGITFYGGKHSPYVWLKCPNGMTSWEYFDFLLEEAGVVGTPGAGFGENGEGYFRLTAFGNKDNTKKAMKKLMEIHKK